MVERLFLTVPRGCLQFVIVVFPDHTHLLLLEQEKPTRSQQSVCIISKRMPLNITAMTLIQLLAQSFRLRTSARSTLGRVHSYTSGIQCFQLN